MNEYLEKVSAECCPELEANIMINVSDVFCAGDCLAAKNLYVTRFGRIPNWIDIRQTDCAKAGKWLMQNYKDNIIDCSYIKRYRKNGIMYFDDVYYFLFDDILIYMNENESTVKLLYKKTDSVLVDNIANKIKKFKKRETRKKPEMQLLVTTQRGLDTQSMEITRPKFSIEENYNDDFLSVHQTILNRLRKKNDKGLVLLHGKPGTGKTSYIRYLITKTQKPVIFLPPNMAATITDPGLMNILIMNPNSIFVIEDAENIIIDRNRSGSSPVSALLNLADGLLSDCLNIQIICSFNTDLSRVDSALTRKG